MVGGIFKVSTGKKILVLKNYFYNEIETESDDLVHWKCTSWAVTGCAAFIMIRSGEILEKFIAHNHDPVDPRITGYFKVSRNSVLKGNVTKDPGHPWRFCVPGLDKSIML